LGFAKGLKGMANANNPEAAVGQFIHGERTTMEFSANHELIQVTAGELGQCTGRVPALGGGLRSKLNVEEPAFDLVSMSIGHVGLHRTEIVAPRQFAVNGQAQIVCMRWKARFVGSKPGTVTRWCQRQSERFALGIKLDALRKLWSCSNS